LETARRHFAVAREMTKSPFDRELIDRCLADAVMGNQAKERQT
jgi:hypothetical protein